MRPTLIPVVALASFYATFLARKLFSGLNERGVKPVACNVCMSMWLSLLFSLLLSLDSLSARDAAGWFELLVLATAAAGGSLLLLESYGWAQFKLGWRENARADDYEEPK